jgi:hypothetical protein
MDILRIYSFDSIILPNIVIPQFWNMVMRLCPINLLSNALSECSPEDQNMNCHSSEHFSSFIQFLGRSEEDTENRTIFLSYVHSNLNVQFACQENMQCNTVCLEK